LFSSSVIFFSLMLLDIDRSGVPSSMFNSIPFLWCSLRLALCSYYSRVLGGELSSSFDNRKSTKGFLIFLGRKLISWKSAKQRIVALPSTSPSTKQ
jgi:hypothetical protein